jgi:hypothetical protein
MLDGPQFDQAIYRLSQYRPFNEEGRDIDAAIHDLVMAAAVVEGDGFSSLQACADAIEMLWHLEVEIDELRSVVDEMVESGEAVRDGARIVLSKDAIAKQNNVAAESEAVEEEAFSDWRLRVLQEVPDLADAEWEALCSDLHAWLGAVISRHGVESALILYPENPKAKEVFDSIEDLGLNFLPSRSGRVRDMRDWAFQQFVRSPTNSQRIYLASLLNTAFYMTVLTLDPSASNLVQEQISGQRVYLDTNFIYALLGLGVTAKETLSAARLIELTHGLGYQLAVTQWTIDELRTSLRAAERRLTRLPLPRQDLAQLMTMRTGENQITKAYWMKYRDSGIQPKDFLEYYSHVEALLGDFQIEVKTEGCVAVSQDQTSINEQLSLLERFMGFRDKEDVVKEHDVKHRLLIERLRGEGHVTFSNARYWFLTRDTKLPRYAMATLEDHRVELPFCVATSAWVQIMRAFTPRTEDFDQSLVDLLATPYLRYRTGPGVSPEVVNAVVARIAQYKGATPSLAAEVLADTALTERIAAATSDHERDQQIEDAFVMKAKEFEERAEASERREAELRSLSSEADAAAKHAREQGRKSLEARRSSEAEAATLAQAQAEASQVAAEARAKADELERRVNEQSEEHKAREAELLKQKEAEERKRSSAERTTRRALAGLVAFIAVAAALSPVFIASLRTAVGICVAESIAALALCLTIWLGFGDERGAPALRFIFGFSGIVGLIVSIVLGTR